jgi:NAD+ kinase
MPYIQVVFDPENSHRRKSSLVSADTPAHVFQRNKSTTCFVHSLLEAQRRRGEYSGSLDGIAETLGGKNVISKEQRPGANDRVEPKGGDARSEISRKDTLSEDSSKEDGQPDEQTWRDRHKEPSGDLDPSATHSRLLTKKQLSDMAWGVRELSKRLGSIRLKLKVKTVFILTKAHDETLIENTREVVRWLLSEERQVRYTVYVENILKDNKKFNAHGIVKELEEQQKSSGSAVSNGDASLGTRGLKAERRLRYWTNDMCRLRPHTFDFVVTLGGDGTVLYASWLFQRIVPPVLSFALGSLGFLTKFDYEDFQDTLTRAFRDGVLVSLRLRFEGTVMRSQKRKKKAKPVLQGSTLPDGQTLDGEEEEDDNKRRDLVEELIGEETEDEWTHKPDGTYEILNDIVVDRGPNPSMSLSFTIFHAHDPATNLRSHVFHRNLRR